ncbi:MAG TPA: ATP-binding protein [Anaerolineae bacterium]
MVTLTNDFKRLRRQAQEKIKQQPPAELAYFTSKDQAELVEELYIHHVELKLQYDSLLQTKWQLELSYDRYKQLYDLAPVGYFTLDKDGYFVTVNLTGARQLGVPKAQLVRQRITDYIARTSQETYFFHRRKLLQTQTSQVCELEMITADGTHFYGHLESLFTPVGADDNPLIQIVLSDITDRRQAEEALQKHHVQLESLVQARTAQLILANEQLEAEIRERERAQAALQAGHRRLEQVLEELKASQEQVIQRERLAAVGHLAAGIAHDFNNILTGIIGHAELLRLQPGVIGTSGERSADVIVQQSERAAHLVRQILDFSRKSIRQPRLMDLNAFLAETVAFLKRTIPENIQLRLEVDPGDYKVNADPNQLQQLLANLIVNARDAMPGGGRLTVSLAGLELEPADPMPLPELTAGSWVVLNVSDTGSGISAEAMSHIFEPFFTTKEPGRGTGLGLAQVYGIVMQHDGNIEVISQPDQGATFTIYLPRSFTRLSPPVSDVQPPLPKGRGETILLIEDEAAVLDVIQRLLETLNYNVLVAPDGQAGLTLYHDQKDDIALVMTDMIMPELEAAGLFEALQVENPAVKILLMTGYPLGEETERLMALGLTAWIKKPLNLSRLAQVVSRTLETTG